MALSREGKIWINQVPFELARTSRTFHKKSNSVTVKVRFLSGENQTFSSEYDTVFQEEKPYLDHGDKYDPKTSISEMFKLDTSPEVMYDKLATEVAPTGELNLTDSKETTGSIMTAEYLREKGYAGFFIRADLSREGKISTTQDIYPLSIVNRIISSERRDLLLIFWTTIAGNLKETHYPLSQVRQWAALTNQELKNKKPNFIAPKA